MTWRILSVGICLVALLTPTLHGQQSASVRGFSISLLVGETQGSVPQGLSASAQKALFDARDFLPYKGYRLLDTQWVAGTDFGNNRGRLRGVAEQEYDFELETYPREIQAKQGTSDAVLSRARFHLKTSASGPAGTDKRDVTTVIDSMFAIKAGETVLVGTSRLKGDVALIVLLTAVAAS